MLKKIVKKIIEIVAIFALALAITSTFKIAQVSGHSMDPTLADGDILVVFAYGKPSDQDIVILDTKGTNLQSDFIVKRYYEDKSTDDEVWLEGDNKAKSYDSRVLGTFDKDKVSGVVIFDITQKKVF